MRSRGNRLVIITKPQTPGKTVSDFSFHSNFQEKNYYFYFNLLLFDWLDSMGVRRKFSRGGQKFFFVTYEIETFSRGGQNFFRN
jgi:hypothetical protein